MQFLEKNLEDIIFETDNSLLYERGLFIMGRKKRQVRLGNYGISDLITVSIKQLPHKERYLHFTVYELKQDLVNINTFLQGIGYCKGLKSYLDKNKDYDLYTISLVLIGKNLDKGGNFPFLPDLIKCDEFSPDGISLSIYTYTYEFNGIQFQEHDGYTLTNEGF
jgi:hypothetical protein